MRRLPILRQGREYGSPDVLTVPHYRTREPYLETCQARSGVLREDLLRQAAMKEKLACVLAARLVALSHEAARSFLNDILPVAGGAQSPEDYVHDVSATTGWPEALVRENMRRTHCVLANVEHVLDALTRGLDLSILDEGHGSTRGQAISFYPRTHALGVVLPESSPRVHPLWVPALALKTPVILSPGSAEPWTPFRIVQSFIRAGAPLEAFGFYPSGETGANEILERCGRGMLFGRGSVARAWRNDSRVETHGPGYSKIVIGDDCVDDWERFLDVIAASVLDNAGRSCLNASGIWVTRNGDTIAEALAQRLAKVLPRPVGDPNAKLAPFLDPAVAQAVSSIIDNALRLPGAEDVTARVRGSDRFVRFEGCAYLLPTVVKCTALHSLANTEFLFPFVSVVEVRETQLPEILGDSLVVTAMTENPRLRHRLLTSPLVGRLNFGPIPTNQFRWDQPNEGNLFEHLYARRAFQAA